MGPVRQEWQADQDLRLDNRPHKLMGNAPRIRLDELLVQQGHYSSRARAREAILRGCVIVDGQTCTKPARMILPSGNLEINDPAARLVSRAALKLVHALKETGYDPAGKVAVDLGASTGGFCQILLERGAAKVFAVDVGHEQLADKLRGDPRLINLEGLNARDLTLKDLENTPPQFITCDVSFISLKLALPAALNLAAPGAQGIFLIKPQFEVGKAQIGKGGIVRDATIAMETAEAICEWLSSVDGWRCTHFMDSPIKGGDGNQEFLMVGEKLG